MFKEPGPGMNDLNRRGIEGCRAEFVNENFALFIQTDLQTLATHF